jgi:FkbM family methyltransferase
MRPQGHVLIGVVSTIAAQHDIPRVAVEFGAGPVNNVVTRLLVQRPGWRGIWFEPHPVLYGALVENVKENQLPVELINKAVSDHSFSASFYCCEEHPGWSGFRDGPLRQPRRQIKATYTEIEVDCCQLVDVLHNQTPGVMVCDMEGSELVVLNDMMRNTTLRPAVMMIEAHGRAAHKQHQTLLTDEYQVVWQLPNLLDTIYVRRDLLGR